MSLLPVRPAGSLTTGLDNIMTTPTFASNLPGWNVAGTAEAVPASTLDPVPPLPAQAPSTPVSTPTVDAYAVLPAAAKVALLSAVRDSFSAILEREKAVVADLNQDASEPVKQNSPFGQVNYQPGKPKQIIDDDALLEYVKTQADLAQYVETVEIVPDWVRSSVIESAAHQGDGIFTFKDGTVAEFVSQGTPSKAQVAYPASKQQKATKAAAEEAALSMLSVLAERVTNAARQAQ